MRNILSRLTFKNPLKKIYSIEIDLYTGNGIWCGGKQLRPIKPRVYSHKQSTTIYWWRHIIKINWSQYT